MSNLEKSYDVIIVGAGFGGYTCALKLAKNGLKVALVEKNKIGGVCLNIGCIPTKTLLKSALVYHDILVRSDTFGVEIGSCKPKINWEVMNERKRSVVSKLINGMQFMVKKNNVTWIEGNAIAIDKNTIEVNGETFTCNNLVIATGSEPIKLNLPGFEKAREDDFLIDSTRILDLPEIPKKLIVVGGGVIGIEFANLFTDLGTEVIILEGMPNILNGLDGEIVKEMAKILATRETMKIITNAKVKEIKDGKVVYEIDGKDEVVEGDYCLESIGRRPVIDGFEKLNLEVSNRKAIVVDDNCETSVKGVYAVGDVFGKAMLAHVAQHSGNLVATQILINHSKKLDNLNLADSVVPACIYTNPEVSMVGKTEEQLKADGIEYNSAKYQFAANGKSLADEATKGFIKILSDKKTKKVLGAHMIGHRVTELISEICLAIDNDLTVEDIARTIHPHPTTAEMIGEVAEMLATKD